MTSASRAPRAVSAAAVGVAGLLALGARAAAQDDTPARPQIRMHIAADALAADVLADGLRARLEALGASLTWDEVAAVDAAAVLEGGGAVVAPALAEVWLDARAAREAVLLILPGQGDGVLARRLALPSGLDDVAQAEIGYIVERAATTLLAAEPFGTSRAAAHAELADRAAEAPAPPPAVSAVAAPPPLRAPAAAATGLSFQVGAVAGVQTWSAAQPWLGTVGFFVALERAIPQGRLGFALSGGLRSHAQATMPDAHVTVGGGDLHLWLTLAKALAGGGVWQVSVGPGLFIDSVAITPAAAAPRTVKIDTSTHVDPTVGVSVRRDLLQLGRVAVFVSASADVFPWPARYTALVDGETTTLIQPWLVRPSLKLGAAFGSR